MKNQFFFSLQTFLLFALCPRVRQRRQDVQQRVQIDRAGLHPQDRRHLSPRWRVQSRGGRGDNNDRAGRGCRGRRPKSMPRVS